MISRNILAVFFAVFLAGCGSSATPEQNWQTAWARGEKVQRPEWAGGERVLAWPSTVPEDIPEKWARSYGIYGETKDQIETRFGKPEQVLENESVSTELFVYRDFCVCFHYGKCHGRTPRSANFEKYFVQPDI